ncbi:unnamed protein product [Lactuca virosa]|uniref:Protein kinase domain-containing protein n=1 Tax=Lactuca virosa TaxID=75947 RepID=A0AAU9MC36_9ASTR|nr:unnamed protein product [Lactuca virosa]
MKEFARIARYCLHTEPKQRPTMAEVVVKLESILSQETEIANSVVSEEGLIYKLRSIFTGKVGASIGSKSDFSMYHEYIRIEIDTTRGSNKDESFRTFTYAELASATNDFMEEVYTPTLYESIYKGWVDERTYDPTESGVGLAIYVRKIEILWKDFSAQLSDFSFVSFTFQMDRYYAAPEWFRYRANRFDSLFHEEDTFVSLHRLSPADDFAMKNEIYAFGVVLLEILTGMMVYDEERPLGKENLVEWAIPFLADEVSLRIIMDPQLQHNDCPPKGAFKLAQLVLNCLHPKKDERPSMEEILQVLNRCYHEEIKIV